MGAAILMVGCGAARDVSGQPSGTGASATAQPTTPPEGKPLIWYSDSVGHLVALDWSGKTAGQVALNGGGEPEDHAA